MRSEKITIINKLGLHARAAAKMVATASRFGSKIELNKGDKIANAKSIMAVMMLAATCGTEIEITVDGDDEDAAMTAIIDLINDRFQEEE